MFEVALNTMLSLFLCIIVGYICGKIGFITDQMTYSFNKLLINITFPAMIIGVFNIELTQNILKLTPLVLLIAIIYNIILWILAILFTKLFHVKKSKELLTFCFIFTNAGFIGYPLIDGLYGKEGLVYLTIISIIFNILMFTFGVYILREDETKHKIALKKSLTTPVMISIWIGLFLLLSQLIYPNVFESSLGVTRLPFFISSAIAMIGGITSPLAMLIVGSSLVKTDVVKVFLDKKLHIFSFLRLIVAPIIVYLILKPFVSNEILLNIVVIISGLPTITVVVILAEEFGLDYVFASEIVFMTTLYSIITIPLLLLLI